MTLLDSNIAIDYFRDRKSELAQVIDSIPAALCGVVRAEVLHGARNSQEIDQMLEAFKTFDTLFMDEYDWDGIGFMLQCLRENGFTLPLSDVAIAFTAMKYDADLWTNDHHFLMIKAVYPELRLYA